MLKFKENKRKQSENKTQKGITLIALVISVIVLLILAGVSISAITGNEGAMEKAKQARSKNEQGAEEDAIKLAVVSAMSKGTYGMAEPKNLRTELADLVTSTAGITDGSAGPWTVEAKNSKIQYEISKYGEVTKKSGISMESTLIFMPGVNNTENLTATLSSDLSGTIKWTLEGGTVSGSTSSNDVVSITPLTGSTITVTKVGNSGMTTITAQLEGTSYSKVCTVKIVEAVNSVTISPETLNVGVGETTTTKLSAIVKGLSGNATEANISYISSNENVATVNANGEVTGVTEGEAEITVKATQGTREVESNNICTVTVEKIYPLWNGIKRNKILSTTQNTELEDNKGNKIWLPANFMISKDNAENGDAGNNVEEGTIIEDANGNQFVWIPVGTITKNDGTETTISLSRYTFDSSTGEETNQGDSEIIIDQSGINYVETTDLTEFKNSVSSKRGYYIARYEAGIVGTTGSTSDRNYTINGNTFDKLNYKDNVIVSQAGRGVWNILGKDVALNVSKNMYDNSKYKSDLMNSYAWDTAIVFIEKCGNKNNSGNYANQTRLSSSLVTTGEANDEQCHINDMAGNVREWTTESPTRYFNSVKRGSNFDNDGSRNTSTRAYCYSTDTFDNTGFRPILYLID